MTHRSVARFTSLLAFTAAFLSGGCETNILFPTPDLPSQSVIATSGPLEPNSRANYVFTLDVGATTQVTLAGAIASSPLRSVFPRLSVYLGFWIDNECLDLEGGQTIPRFSPVLQRQLPNGTFCVGVEDTEGALTEPVDIVVRITAPILLETGGLPGTTTFASSITPGGAATRTIDASKAGTVQLTLTSLSPATTAGFGLGVWSSVDNTCKLARALVTSPGSAPQITEPVEAGTYCVTVFDTGAFSGLQNFSVNIAHP